MMNDNTPDSNSWIPATARVAGEHTYLAQGTVEAILPEQAHYPMRVRNMYVNKNDEQTLEHMYKKYQEQYKNTWNYRTTLTIILKYTKQDISLLCRYTKTTHQNRLLCLQFRSVV